MNQERLRSRRWTMPFLPQIQHCLPAFYMHQSPWTNLNGHIYRISNWSLPLNPPSLSPQSLSVGIITGISRVYYTWSGTSTSAQRNICKYSWTPPLVIELSIPRPQRAYYAFHLRTCPVVKHATTSPRCGQPTFMNKSTGLYMDKEDSPSNLIATQRNQRILDT